MYYAGMFKNCYVDQVWVGCSGDYDHSDRGLLILAVIAGIVLIGFILKRYFKNRREYKERP
jgi:hypothetical protein